ncbi:MAG: Endonuclease/Exonuclease/phosphatase family protein [Verrucomicrobiales bacterium]|nr:Endonuclease/Exonuclease/phosphatase family protein [Verrucomicrobiales bacterium]
MLRGATTNVVSDNYNVSSVNPGFALNDGINTGINPPTTRLTGSAKANLRYINTGTKADSSYSLSGNKLQVIAAPNPGRFVLSSNSTTSFDFASALGTGAANATNPVVYDLAITMNNSSTNTARFSFALGTVEGDANTWSFGLQIYRAGSGDNFYTIGKRIDTSSSGLAGDLNESIATLTPNTYGGDISVLLRVTDAGSETAYHSRVQVSLNDGNSWIYDTKTDSDLTNGWRLNGASRHIMWDIAGGADVTYDSFSLKLNPPLSNVNTSSTFRAMTYNIHSASGPDGKVNTQRIANFILDQNVDLVVLNEVARFMARSDGRDTIGELALETGMSMVFSNNNTALTGNDQFGNAILSKYPILFRDHRLLPVVGDNEQRGWLKAIVDMNGKFLSVWTTHLDFHADNTERLMCGTNLNTWLADEMFPVIMGGDFNDTPDTPIYNLLDNKWTDIWLGAGDGSLGRSVPCPGPPFNARIDYLWKANTSSLTPTNAFVGYGVEGSDHYPVISQFILTTFTNHASGFYFPFDQGSGTKVTDSIGGLTGKLGTGAPTWSTNSPTGQTGDFSLFFDGTKKITVTDTNQIIGTNGLNDDYTLQAWVRVAVNYAPSARAILFQYERRPGFALSINTNRTLHTTTFKIKDITSTATIPNDGQWHHVAVVHTDGANMKFYIDATLAATVTYTNGAGFRTSSEITIGSAADDANPFTGYLSRVKFDSRALTSAQLDFPAVPPLGIRSSGNLLTLFWPAVATNYTLQANGSLQTTGWTNVPTQVQTNEIQATVAVTNSTKFFRLKRQ